MEKKRERKGEREYLLLNFADRKKKGQL